MIDRFFDGLVQTWFGSDRNLATQQKLERDTLSLDIASGTYRLLEGIDSGIAALAAGASRLRHGDRHSPVGCG
ncbi:MAG TPA: hypothetical protein VHA10_10575 [Hypericibacter adhaerens]|jgi:hypothetical protein|uniref:Uncharacterized protein n=1 Tax=Hypericibacter adhaerens TaxID=2602016 RepID=A0A5J6N574_9PROT|nr:hypothetical protein [Hypericibacter adhaerens]QEX25029.1 hypothetical protein FRZ61_49730 [Hypericibacter adhaerens]HWA43644.1 hypothetical protein [Hypericibacter adhaerens]